MAKAGQYSWQEITTQRASWRSAIEQTLAQREALRALFARNAGRPIYFTGCGSTHYLALYAAPFFQCITGLRCRGVPASELWLQTNTLLGAGEVPLVIALSRSGATSETIAAVRRLRAQGAEALTISCYADTELAAASTLTIDIPEGREESYAQTRSFAGMLVAVQTLAALVAEDAALLAELQRLPGLAEGLIARANDVAQAIGADARFQRITYLGSGPRYGLAGEAMIKMKEMSLSLAEAFHFMEFRHGPMSLVDEHHLVVGLMGDETRDYETAVLADLKARGAYVLAIANLALANDDEGLGAAADQVFALQAPVGARSRDVLYLPPVQLLAYHRAMARGLNPDRPRNVVMAIRLDGAEMV
jgi:glucosamine--fructose-6-phosphate aminotransferase (isomerizing)